MSLGNVEMHLTSEILILLFAGMVLGLLIGFVAQSVIIARSNMLGGGNIPVEINAELSVSDIPDHYVINSRPPSYQSNEGERPLSPDSAEDPSPYRYNENLDVEMIEMRPIPPSK